MKLPIIISLILSISIIIIILYLTIDSETIQHLTTQKLKYEFFIIAIILNIIYWILWGVRLKILSNAIDKKVKISLWKSSKIIIANLFLANITPSMAGGEPIRIYLLNKEGLSIGESTAVVLGERLLDAIFLIICFPFAFYIFRTNIETGPIAIALTIAVAVFIIAVLLFAYSIKNPKKIKSFLCNISKKIRRFSKKKDTENTITDKINYEVDNFHKSMIFFLSDGKKAFFSAGLLTIIFWIVGWLIPPFILMGLGLKPYLVESIAAQILLIIIVMMPTTPGSSGVSEGGTVALFSVFVNSSMIGIFVLIFRLITYHMGLIAGAIFQYKIFKSVASFSMDTIKRDKSQKEE